MDAQQTEGMFSRCIKVFKLRLIIENNMANKTDLFVHILVIVMLIQQASLYSSRPAH